MTGSQLPLKPKEVSSCNGRSHAAGSFLLPNVGEEKRAIGKERDLAGSKMLLTGGDDIFGVR